MKGHKKQRSAAFSNTSGTPSLLANRLKKKRGSPKTRKESDRDQSIQFSVGFGKNPFFTMPTDMDEHVQGPTVTSVDNDVTTRPQTT